MTFVQTNSFLNKQLSSMHLIMSKHDVTWIRTYFSETKKIEEFIVRFSRCVTNKRPLIESGTMGPKGHTFVVIPYKSESYSNQVSNYSKHYLVFLFFLKNDPIDRDVPYCNVKSFPANIEHCTIWAREKVST